MPILFIVIFKCFVHDKAVALDLQKQLSCAFFFPISQSLDFLQYVLPPLPHQIAFKVGSQIHMSYEEMSRKPVS